MQNIYYRNNNITMIFLIFIITFSLMFPILGVYIWALGLLSGKKWFDLAILIYYCLFFSFFVALRDPMSGFSSAGYGMDAGHYMNAFEALSNYSIFDFESVRNVAKGNTGSNEPLFWFFAHIFQLVFLDRYIVWIVFSFIGLLLISIPYFCFFSSRRAFIILACYVSTITFYVFQGSGIRQGLAFSVLSFAFVAYINKFFSLSILGSLVATLIHYSAAPVMAVFIFSAFIKRGIWTKIIIGLFSTIILLLSSYHFITEQIYVKSIGYLEQASTQKSAYLQFIIESVFIFYLARRLGSNRYSSFVKDFLGIFLLFSYIIAIITGIVMSGGGFERYYRYLYIISLFIVSEYACSKVRVNSINSIFSGPWVIMVAASWMLFLVFSRYQGLFVEGGVTEHLLYSPFLNLW